MIRSFIDRAHGCWANLPPLLRFMGVLVVLAALALFGVKPAYQQFKSLRLEQNLRSAQTAVEQERMQEARDLSLTVLRSGDPRVDAFRILEKSSAALRDPRHGEIARALMIHPEGTEEDRLNGFRGIVMDLPLGPVGDGWASLPPELQQDPRFAAAFAGRLLAEKRFSEAVIVLLGVPEQDRDGEIRRGLARTLIGSGKREGFEEAQRMVVRGILDPEEDSRKWLEVMNELPVAGLLEEILRPLRDALGKIKEVSPAETALLLARMDYAGNFSSRGTIIDGVITKWKEADPVGVALFLKDLGLHRRLIETFPLELFAKLSGLFPLLQEALVYSADWDGLERLMEVGEGMLPDAELLGYQAMVAAKTGNSVVATHSWTAALNEARAGQTAHQLLKLHRIAAMAGMVSESELAMVEAIRLGRGPLPLFSSLKDLMASLERQGRDNVLMEICAIYLQFERENPVLLTQYAYLACLNDLVEPAPVLAAMGPMAEAFPDQLPIQAVAALAYLMNAQPEMAAERLGTVEWDPEQASSALRIIFYTSEVLNGRMEKNDSRLARFSWNSLLPSERKKFSELLRANEL